MGTMKADWQCKLIIIGDTGVGKTCVMRRFTDNEFSYNFVATIGIDFKIRMVRIQEKAIKVQIWDTAGQEKFRSITTAYYRGAKGVLIVYDITSETSFQNVTKWVKSFRRWAGSEVESMLIGNKCDVEEGRQVQRRDGEKLAKDHGMFFTETSAKENINVDKAFMEILTVIVDKHKQQMEERKAEADGQAVRLSSTSSQQGRGGGCCKN